MLLSILWVFLKTQFLQFMVYVKEQFQGYTPVTVSAEMKIGVVFVDTIGREFSVGRMVGSLAVHHAEFSDKSEQLWYILRSLIAWM